MRLTSAASLAHLDFSRGDGLLPMIAQHAHTGEVLMLGYASRTALERTLETGLAWFHSRSRNALWQKGETSGNVLRLQSLHTDCDGDAVLALVLPDGPTCHTGARTCFSAPPVLPALADTLARRDAERPEGSYTARLLADANLRLKKLGEEAVELALACAAVESGPEPASAEAARAATETPGVADAPERSRVSEEAADLLYHLLVACHAAGVAADQVLSTLAQRMDG